MELATLELNVVRLCGEGRAEDAIRLIDAAVAQGRPTASEKWQLGQYRAYALEMAGRMEEAVRLYEALRDEASPRSRERYDTELYLAWLLDRLGSGEAARAAYHRAMIELRVTGNDTGVAALDGFIKNSTALTPDEKELCCATVREAWAFQGLAGEPDLEDLADSSRRLLDKFLRG
jgi:hypothetical protein